jgi:hypothetical protein
MIHYSVLPPELVFFQQDSHHTDLEECMVDGVQMLVRRTGESEITIVRLLSADPAHYLDPRFQPGRKIAFAPKI